MATDEGQTEPTVPDPTVPDAAVQGEQPTPTDETASVPVEPAPASAGTPTDAPATSEAPVVDESGTTPTDVPPEFVTPAPGGEDLVVPSAAGESTPPTSIEPSEADAASPTPGANVAGTPQSQLSQAPPMRDESGGGIPAPNLVQPLDGDFPAGPDQTAESLDPALVDPVATAAAEHEGTVNDAAVRAEGVGQGDVEVATIPENTGGVEYWPALTVEDEVVLLEHELVPERLVGRRAFIIDAPRFLVPVGEEHRVWVTVKTRDEFNATLTIPLSAGRLERGGRNPVVRG